MGGSKLVEATAAMVDSVLECLALLRDARADAGTATIRLPRRDELTAWMGSHLVYGRDWEGGPTAIEVADAWLSDNNQQP